MFFISYLCSIIKTSQNMYMCIKTFVTGNNTWRRYHYGETISETEYLTIDSRDQYNFKKI